MTIKRIAPGYYDIIHRGFHFGLERDSSGLWRLYLCNIAWDHLNRLVISRTKSDALLILNNYTADTIENIAKYRWAKQMELA